LVIWNIPDGNSETGDLRASGKAYAKKEKRGKWPLKARVPKRKF